MASKVRLQVSHIQENEEWKKQRSLNGVSTYHRQIIFALGILNVWILRYGKSTNWRAGMAKNMREEFEVYGIPFWFMKVIGFTKIVLALFLIAGIWIPVLTKPAAACMCLLMLGAVGMHLKVKDAPKKALPALTLVILSLIVAVV